MSVVDGLLRIKRVREDVCEQAVRRARMALDEASAALERAQQGRRQRDGERQAREREMVARLLAGAVGVRDIEWVRVDIDGLRRQAAEDLQQEEAAHARREQERDGVRTAMKARQIATRITEKFVSLAERDRRARLTEAERLADLELEDFRARAPEAGEWAETLL